VLLGTIRFETRAAPARQSDDCLACHPRSFAGELHGQGINNQGFKDAWNAQEKPQECLQCHVTGYDPATNTWVADSITCVACHSPIPNDHPNQDVPVDKSTDLCAQCHNDSRFGWNDWKVSTHYQRNLTCAACHNPHISKRSPEDAVTLCDKCHQDISQRAEHSIHAQTGVTCINCHLGNKKGPDDFHKVHDHGFRPELETCNSCHSQQMHDAVLPIVVNPTPTPMDSGIEPDVTTGINSIAQNKPEPAPLPIAPSGYFQLDSHYLPILFGVAGGIILSSVTRKVTRALTKSPSKRKKKVRTQ
jgi:predicted CXXCH cytochrome family protein